MRKTGIARPYVAAINSLKRAFGRQQEKAWYVRDFEFKDFHEGDDVSSLDYAVDFWGWRFEIPIYDDGILNSDVYVMFEKDGLEIAQFIHGPIDAEKHFRHSIMNITRQNFLDPEKFSAIIPIIVEQSKENIRITLEYMRKNPGTVFAKGLHDALIKIFDYEQTDFLENGDLIINGTVGDFAEKGLFPAICASFSPDSPMRCEVETEGWRDNYDFGVLISVTDQSGKELACHWGWLTETVQGDPLEIVKDIIQQMRSDDIFTPDQLK